MAITLNLLPPELAVDKNLSSLLKGVRAIGIILLAGFLVFIVGVTATFIISSVLLKNTTTRLDQLKAKIGTQQTTEQKLVLLKDRLKNIATVKNTPGSLKNLNTIEPLLLTLSPDSSVAELNVDSQKITLTINFRSNKDLSDFFDNVEASDKFKSVVLSSFGFNPASGYLAGVSIVSK